MTPEFVKSPMGPFQAAYHDRLESLKQSQRPAIERLFDKIVKNCQEHRP